MKSVIFCISFLFVLNICAQSDKVKWGLNAGMNLATLSSIRGDLDEKMHYKSGIYFGGFAYSKTFEKIADIKLEAMYSQQGGIYKVNGFSQKYVTDYLSTGCLVKINPIKRLYCDVGFVIDFLLKSDKKIPFLYGSHMAAKAGVEFRLTKNIGVEAKLKRSFNHNISNYKMKHKEPFIIDTGYQVIQIGMVYHIN